MFLSDYAAQKGIDPFDALCDLLVINGGVGTAIYHCMSEEDLNRIFTFPHTVVGTDGICRAMEEKAHPRSFGTFVRAICHFHKEKNLMALEDVIRKMTSLPASRAMLSNKGILAEGYDADINIFDLEQLEDTPNYVHSNQVCKGMETVIVNGVVVYENGSLTGQHGGKILLHHNK